MRKALLFALMLTLLLTACGGEEKKDPAAALQAEYAAVASADMEADITCHYDNEVRQYTLLCAYTPESSLVTVLAPEDLAGISAEVKAGELILRYDDISLDAVSYSAAAVSPVAVLPSLMEAAAAGYGTEVSEESLNERQCLRMSCDLSEDLGTVYTTWFDQETLLPLRSEVCVDGTVVYEVVWNRFAVTEKLEQPSPEEPGDGVENSITEDQPAAG